MINVTWPVYQGVDDKSRYVRAVQITKTQQYTNGQLEISFGDGFPEITVDSDFTGIWNPVVGAWVVQANDGSLSVITDANFKKQFSLSSGSKVSAGDIVGAGATGISVLESVEQIDARTAIGIPQANYAYVIGNRGNSGGEPQVVPISSGPSANNIALRDAAGCVATATPSSAVHSTPKSYVDALKPATATLADTATKLATARSIALSGDLSGNNLFDGSAGVSISATIGNGTVNNAKVSSTAGIVGTKIVTAAAVTSAGAGITIPAGTTLDAALKIIVDKVNPASS